ncbi:MAG: PIG-L family deacetylase [Proteobacteria bacterium]|nr:PIG-L family deacetylase [Pseudomonadota bacterium]
MGKETRLEPFPEDWERALAVVAHPDDLEYGAASAIARWTSQGRQVTYLILTRGEAGIDSVPPEKAAILREDEERKSARLVGVDTVLFLGYKDGIIEYGLSLRQDITRAIRQQCPDIIVTLNYHLTWDGVMLNMADHRWVGLAVLDAARDAGNRWIFSELTEEGLEPWNSVRMVCVSGSPQPTHAVDVTSFLDKGIASLKEHRIYLENLSGSFDPEAFLRESAAATGKRFGSKFAVSFEVIRI